MFVCVCALFRLLIFVDSIFIVNEFGGNVMSLTHFMITIQKVKKQHTHTYLHTDYRIWTRQGKRQFYKQSKMREKRNPKKSIGRQVKFSLTRKLAVQIIPRMKLVCKILFPNDDDIFFGVVYVMS